MQLSAKLTKEEWEEIFKKITYWELELDQSGDSSMKQILEMQKAEANTQFLNSLKKTIKTGYR